MTEYIERETAIRALCDATAHTCNYRDCGKGCEDAQTILSIPAADVQPVRHGRWVKSEIPDEKFVCSECGGACWYYDYEGEVARSRYCPNCGAKMDGT